VAKPIDGLTYAEHVLRIPAGEIGSMAKEAARRAARRPPGARPPDSDDARFLREWLYLLRDWQPPGA
jgi:hypothetical protein